MLLETLVSGAPQEAISVYRCSESLVNPNMLLSCSSLNYEDSLTAVTKYIPRHSIVLPRSS